MIRASSVAVMLLAGLPGQARAATRVTPSDFTGSWRIAVWAGESKGGFTGPDPNTLIGKVVQIEGGTIVTPDRTCRMRNASVAEIRNSDIEAGIWGGQLINQLRLPRREIVHAFGRNNTPVFHDKDLCVSAVMIDHDHIIDALGSGVLYRLDRVK